MKASMDFTFSVYYEPGVTGFTDEYEPYQGWPNALSENEELKPAVVFEKINPTRYQLQVTASTPFFLIFGESFHRGWKLYSGDVNWLGSIYKRPVSEGEHFIVNGYANAWYVDKLGTYDLTLYFWPQTLVYIGLVILILAFIAGILYSMRDKIHFHRRRNR